MIDPRHDPRFMAAALALGAQGAGRTAPNPSVGAVIVRPGRPPVIVGAGRTADSGRPHAERVALQQAGEAARGASVYVTLEPCSHTGKTSPCADALIEAGIAEVVVATRDPDPRVAGTGIGRLQAAGIAVRVGVREAGARRDLAGHITRMTEHRPFVTLKLAVSANGAIGLEGEGQVAISGPASRAQTHLMRARHDAILVGVGTVLADNPSLTCRLPGMVDRSPTRVVFDSHARTPPDAAVLTGPPPIIVTADPPADRLGRLAEAGAKILDVPTGRGGVDIAAALRALAGEGITTLMLEGGARLAEAFAAENLIDAAVLIASLDALEGPVIRPFGGERAALSRHLRVSERTIVGADRWTHWERQCLQGSSPMSAA